MSLRMLLKIKSSQILTCKSPIIKSNRSVEWSVEFDLKLLKVILSKVITYCGNSSYEKQAWLVASQFYVQKKYRSWTESYR